MAKQEGNLAQNHEYVGKRLLSLADLDGYTRRVKGRIFDTESSWQFNKQPGSQTRYFVVVSN